MFRLATVVVVALGLAGCYSPVGVPIGAGADPDEIPRRVVLATDGAGAETRAHERLRELGFTRDGEVWRRREPADREWAFCPPLRVEIHDDSYDAVRADAVVAEVVLEVNEAEEGAAVVIDPRFIGRYRDTWLTGTRERRCNSFGVFETRFLASLEGAG